MQKKGKINEVFSASVLKGKFNSGNKSRLYQCIGRQFKKKKKALWFSYNFAINRLMTYRHLLNHELLQSLFSRFRRLLYRFIQYSNYGFISYSKCIRQTKTGNLCNYDKTLIEMTNTFNFNFLIMFSRKLIGRQ